MGNSAIFDEMWGCDEQLRQPYEEFHRWFDGEDPKRLRSKQREAEELFRLTGITFNVYGRAEAEERLIPFDIIPRIISEREWARVTRGIEQRVRAINAFLYDIYHKQEIIKAGRIPREMISRNAAFEPKMIGVKPPGGVYTHIVGIDLVRTGPDEFFVLEDNARTPSGVSYMLENRETMLRMFPELFSQNRVKSVQSYPTDLRRSLAACAPDTTNAQPVVAVLTPGIYNSAYFEHAFLADQMGVELVEGHDLRVVDGRVAMRTTRGYKSIDVLYRRVDDDFIDPLNFNPESQLGVPGLMDVYRAGGITLANAPGTGIADDKAIYSYMPEIVEFYTGEPPLLRNVPTWRCSEPDQLAYVLDNLEDLVVKEVHGSGGYGMLIGPTASKKEIAAFRRKLKARPGNYIAQPTLSLSTVPIFARQGLTPRHVDLRPFVLVSPQEIKISAGGLTRVALKKGSLVVNSSQGGGTKDTWVVED
ncbi:circularly permuted type 2 ATP-grasp protein [Roseovarius faecimaris]|uniref:Circularly permuted type 2 ATP-grasp protein n=1 Tax=Roseovarius faecimaris TaxID=2494550 RepID=A0A6I6IUB1_9RHOB|nr:circularly permuted type 2 ATP-grasp protein [Roseovarius faecimaris]QGX99077.1 circularly permuted type 2 ATP-grasp protein [Roseovarius faecimaris]